MVDSGRRMGKLGIWVLASLTFSLTAIFLGCRSFGEEAFSSIQVEKQECDPTRPVPIRQGNTAGSTIRIGMVMGVTGELAPVCAECVRAARLVVDRVNKKGGIDGKKVELLVEDSASKPEQGKTVAEKLIAKGALAIVGDLGSGVSAQVARACYEKGVPVISVGATRKDFTDIGSNVFRICYTDDVQGKVMSLFAHRNLGVRRVAVLVDKKQPYSLGLCESFSSSFRNLGGCIVDYQYYETGQSSFGAQLTNIKAKNPDCLFLGGYAQEVGPIARQARVLGLNVHRIGADGWDGEHILTSGGQGIIGGYYCTHFHANDPRKQVQKYINEWKRVYHRKPYGNASALAYDAMNLLLSALKNCPSLSSKELTHIIEQTEDFAGVTGDITLKGNKGNPIKGAIIVEVTQSGIQFRKYCAEKSH